MSPPVHSILVRGVNWLGDAVMTIPALHRLREAYPDAHIVLLTPEKLSDLWLRHPAVDQVLGFKKGEGVWSVRHRLRIHRFDLGVVLPNSPRSALEVWLAQARQRIGYARPWRNWLLTRALPPYPEDWPMRKKSANEIRHLTENGALRMDSPPPPSAHHIFHYLHLVAALGAKPTPLEPRIYISDNEVTDAASRFGLPLLEGNKPWVGLNVGAEYGPAKRWPLERFVAAVRQVHEAIPCRWLILGGPSDIPLATTLEDQLKNLSPKGNKLSTSPPLKIINAAGRTTLRELCALLKQCRVVLTNDTGPMHVAAAVGTAVVVPFGSTSAVLTGPGLPGAHTHALLCSQTPCSPCFLRICPIDFRCMTHIPIKAVAQAVLRRLQ